MIKTEFIELYEELNSLNEAVSPEAKAFYDSLNVRTKAPVDTESFIKAFKKDIPDNIWDQLFDANMKLKHRGTYGIIKTGNLPADVTAALKKYWAFQFASSVTWFETTTMIAKQEEAKKKQEEEKLAKVKIYTEKAERVLSLIDKKAAQKLLQLSKEVEPKKAKNITETPEIYVNPPVVGIEFYKFFIYVYNGTYGRSETEPTEQELVDKFNSNVSDYIATLEAAKSLKLAKQNRQEKYKNAKWYSEEFEEWASANKEGIFLFQLPDDEGIQRLTKLSWDIIERCHFTDDVELIAVVTDYKPPKRNPNSATENSYYYKYYSVNSKADPADLEDEGILLDPSKFVDDSSWGQKTYEEVSAESAKRSPSRYFIPGMDKWFEYESESYSTD